MYLLIHMYYYCFRKNGHLDKITGCNSFTFKQFLVMLAHKEIIQRTIIPTILIIKALSLSLIHVLTVFKALLQGEHVQDIPGNERVSIKQCSV